MITRKDVLFDNKVVKVLDFSLMKAHEVLKTIGNLINMDEAEIEDDVQHCLDLHAMREHLRMRGA